MWRSGKRQFEIVNGYWGEGSFGKSNPDWTPGYSECSDTLDGVPYRLITTFNTNYEAYIEVATLAEAPEGMLPFSLAFIGQSPDSADQELFLAIFRTLRVDSTGSSR